ncbi:MAG: type III secretion system domain-containing protein [Arsenophonus endosymbiont of Dermacentor nuttalli]
MTELAVRFNYLLSHPGEVMHAKWWQRIELNEWQSRYHISNELKRRLDKLILNRLGFQPTLYRKLPENIQPWLSLIMKIPFLFTVVGLVCNPYPDYLWDSVYRSRLTTLLSQEQIKQLIALWPTEHHTVMTPWLVEEFLEQAQLYALNIFSHYWQGQDFEKLLSWYFAPLEEQMDCSQQQVKQAVRWLFRLERFL